MGAPQDQLLCLRPGDRIRRGDDVHCAQFTQSRAARGSGRFFSGDGALSGNDNSAAHWGNVRRVQSPRAWKTNALHHWHITHDPARAADYTL